MLTLTPFISKTLHSKSNENMLRVTFVAFFIRNVLKQTQPKSDKKQKKFPTPIISKIDRQTDRHSDSYIPSNFVCGGYNYT
jgi:hypothetical protein